MKLAKMIRVLLFFPVASGWVAEIGEVDMQGLQFRDAGCGARSSRCTCTASYFVWIRAPRAASRRS
jgi:hypothetical protein